MERSMLSDHYMQDAYVKLYFPLLPFPQTKGPPQLAYLVDWLLSDFWKSLNIVSLDGDKERDVAS